MLRFFQRNLPSTRVVVLLVVLGVWGLRVCFSLEPAVFSDAVGWQMPLAEFMVGWLPFRWQLLGVALLTLAQGVLAQRIVVQAQPSFRAGQLIELFLPLLALMTTWLLPQVLAMELAIVLLLFALHLLQSRSATQLPDRLFRATFLITCATLVYWPLAVAIALPLLAMVRQGGSVLRLGVLFLMGILLPVVLLLAVGYLDDAPWELLLPPEGFPLEWAFCPPARYGLTSPLFWIWVILMLFYFVVEFQFRRRSGQHSIAMEYAQAMLRWLVVAAVVAAIFFPAFTMLSLMLAAPLSIAFAYRLNEQRPGRWANWEFLFLLLLLVLGNFSGAVSA